MANQRALVEKYLLEVVARTHAAERRCERLSARDFISTAPEALLRTISRSSAFLRRAIVNVFTQIDWADNDASEDDLRLIRQADLLVREFYAHLRYVDGAQTARLPWSIVASFERLVRGLVPGVSVMLRQMWHYNYATIMLDLRRAYQNALAEYQDFVPDTPIETEVLADLPQPFHIIAFPALERTNILLHCLLGHEIGHLLAAGWLSEERRTQFLEAVLPSIEKLTDRDLDDAPLAPPPLFRPQLREQLLATYAQRASTTWTRAVEELVSDVAGCIVFGPAVLFTCLEMGLASQWDTAPNPASEFYPPWRLRLRVVLATLTRTDGAFFPVPVTAFPSPGSRDRAQRVNDYIDVIRDLVNVGSDREAISADPLTKLCYEHVEAAVREATEALLDHCRRCGAELVPEALYTALPALIGRLDEGIPPNATIENVKELRPATMPAIISAAWYQRLAADEPVLHDGELSFAVLAARKVRNNLTLKAIEFSDLSREYAEGRGATRD